MPSGYKRNWKLEIGKKYNHLTILEVPEKATQATKVYCKCDCGKVYKVALGNIVYGSTKQCASCRSAKANITHGLCHTRLNSIWGNMKSRCYNKNIDSYYRYGKKGITICDEWRNSFKSFYDWAMNNGYSDDLTLDRIDYNGNYCPENCRWATTQQQAFNKDKYQNSSSRFRGVVWHKRDKIWEAYGKLNKKCIHIGYFEDEVEAAKARDEFYIKHNITDARLNFS